MPNAVSGTTSNPVGGIESAAQAPNGAALDQLNAAPSAPTDDSVTAALVALSEFMKQTAAGHRSLKRSEDLARVQHQKQEAAQLREEASAIRTGAYVSGACLAVSAGCSFSAFGFENEKTSALFSALAEPSASAANVSEKLAEAASTEHRADGKEEAALADQARARAEEAKANADDAAQVMKKALEAIQSVAESRHAARLAILNSRA
jgi:hypothetical protein